MYSIKNRLGRVLLCLAFLLAAGPVLFANNIQVSNPTLYGQDLTGHYVQVGFDISWENSWRTSTHESNWDAAWIFIKFHTRQNPEWRHATLNHSTGNAALDGHSVPSAATLKVTSDGKGAFLYSANDITQQSVNYSGLKLRWNYGADGLSDTTGVELQVYAMEMVYVPTGEFYAGTGGSETNGFRLGNMSLPYLVSSENPISMNNMPGMLWAGGNVCIGTLPAAYPKGYQGFYCMKYEISQGQYADFLNTLTRTQQQARIAINISTPVPSNTYAMTNTSTSSARNEITVAVLGSNPSDPLYFASSTPHVPCNYLTWPDAAAYADWSGLRPMSELEYEKACRGNDGGTAVGPVPGEEAWGDTIVTAGTTITQSGSVSEKPGNSGANCAYNGATGGPIRCGSWDGGTRSDAGATWYGILDMSGNLRELVVNVAYINTIPFSGRHGDGAIDASGNADVSNWPYGGAIGLRGGSWSTGKNYLRVSDRSAAVPGTISRSNDIGFRGVRTAP